jgi:hypothetical protein
MSLAAVSTPQPGRPSRLGASRATRLRKSLPSWSIRVVSVWIVATSCWQMPTWTDDWALASQAATRSRSGPGRRRAACSRSGSSWCRCQRSRLIVRVRSATRCSRWSTSSLTSHEAWSWPAVGRSGSPGRCPGDRQRVDGVGLAQGTHGLAGAGHQPGRHPHDAFPGGQQVALQPAGGRAGSPPPPRHEPGASAGGPSRAARRGRACAPRRWSGRAGGRRGRRRRRCGVLVRIDAKQHYACCLLGMRGTLGRPAGTPQLGRCHAPLKPRRSAHDTAAAAQPSPATSTSKGQRVCEPATAAS